jgi:hypothetical protein
MTVIVFTGPTIDPVQAHDVLAADYRPPARVGDVLAAALSRPDAIVIIDGLFDSVPAVWHKEILFSLWEGIHVYGASSMGALRAAELHPFGMVGVGKIYEMYRDGLLEDDDEVAIICGEVQNGRVIALSEAMVNIREGLEQAVGQGVICATTGNRLEKIAKSLHYADRSWPLLLAQARDVHGVPENELTRLGEFVASHDTNLKRRDALELLRRVAADAGHGLVPFQPTFTFERTSLFEALRETVAVLDSGEPQADVLRVATQPPDGGALRRNALLLTLAAAEIQRHGVEFTVAERLEHETRFLAERGLNSAESITTWLSDNQLSMDGFFELVHLDMCVDRIARDRGAALDRFLLAELRRQGRFADILESFRTSRQL